MKKLFFEVIFFMCLHVLGPISYLGALVVILVNHADNHQKDIERFHELTQNYRTSPQESQAPILLSAHERWA